MWNAVKWILLYVIIQFSLIFGFSFIYMSIMNDSNLPSYFISDIQIYLVIILAIIFIPLLLNKYKKFNIKETKTNNFYLFVIFVIGFSIGYNILAYYLDKYILLSNLYSGNINLIVSLISTVLIGPIIEELMFRGVIYNNLKLKFDIKKSMLITTILFCLCHFTLIQIVYTFIFGLILNRIYEKYQNIKYPIILHMVSNLTTTLISLFIINDYLIMNILLLVISIICLCFFSRKVKEVF